MQGKASAASAKGGLLTTIICALAALVALFFVVRTAAVMTVPALAESFPAVSQSIQLRQQARQAANPKFKVDAETLDLARRAAISEPLYFLPYFVAARAAEQRNDIPQAVRLMEEARKRNMTWVPIRLYLVAYYGRAGRVPDMIREIDYALRVNETTRIALLPELVKLLNRRDGRQYVGQMLASNPPWKKDLFSIARDRKVSPEAAAELLRLAQQRGGDTTEEAQLLVSALFAAGQPDLARNQWLASLPQADRQANRFIFNGDFSRADGGGEFGWTLRTLDIGRADIVRGGSGGKDRLRIQYFGGRMAALAEQNLALRPGRYRLSVTGTTGSNAAAAQLFWTISCYPDGPEIHRVPVQDLGTQERSVAAPFAVPASCRAQTIRLMAEPGELSSPTDAEFSQVRIDGAN